MKNTPCRSMYRRSIWIRSALSLCLVAALIAFGACTTSKGDGSSKDKASATDDLTVWKNEEPFQDLDLAEYVKLGEYKGIAVDLSRTETVELGDYAIFDFEGTAPGLSEETLESMKAQRYDQLVIGSGNFIPGFEEQMLGKKIGEAFDVKVTFPEDYAPEDQEGPKELNGKEVTFHCLVHELPGKDAVSMAAQAAYENMDVLKIPDREMEMYRALYDEAAEGSGMSGEEYIEQLGGLEYWTEGMREQVKQEMFVYAVAQQENLKATEEDVQAYLDKMREGDESAKDEELLEQAGGKNLFRRGLTQEKVVEFIHKNAKIS